MAEIQASWDTINNRGTSIRSLLKPIAKIRGGPAWEKKMTINACIIGTHDGSPTKSDYRDWRFATCIPNYRGMYFEKWNVLNREFLYLDRAYLSLYRIEAPQRTETEYICLHCDPNEPKDSPHYKYKRGPHLHVSIAEHPIPHAHIALDCHYLDKTLESIDSLSDALYEAIIMLKQEILSPILTMQK